MPWGKRIFWMAAAAAYAAAALGAGLLAAAAQRRIGTGAGMAILAGLIVGLSMLGWPLALRHLARGPTHRRLGALAFGLSLLFIAPLGTIGLWREPLPAGLVACLGVQPVLLGFLPGLWLAFPADREGTPRPRREIPRNGHGPARGGR
jgi:hypothetical protein